MNWQTLLSYLGAFIAGAVIGWLLHSPGTPKIEVKERIVYDTLYQTKTIAFTKTKTDTVIKVQDNKFAYEDSVIGDTNQVKYNIKHSIKNDKKLTSSWRVNLEPYYKIITKVVTRDSIQTKIEKQFFAQPWFMNTWFYVSIVEAVLFALTIIF